ncbi:HemK methyltransferase member 2 [Tyrophagus putrescentiae]|nr:HemK methyltransferase member 2 [Tyrophagus putrescentiae]
METPLFPLATFEGFFSRSVYNPAEDTFILLDALEADLERIKELNPLISLEVGCGSGAVITSVAKALGPNQRLYLATDINHEALECTRRCSQLNLSSASSPTSAHIQTVQTSLTEALNDRLERSIDLLLFNPPYVPTADEEIHPGLPASWAGGLCGRKIIDQFLADTLGRTLSDTGLAYLVVIEPNNLEEISKAAKKLGFSASTVLTRRCGIEKLSVLRFQRL